MIRVLTPRDYRVMPWKNGGGTTTEIYIHPEGAGWDAFDWRVGIADITQSGPFSSFPGIDRSIMLLECPRGSGMRLTIDDRDVELPLHRFVDFSGEATTHGTLLGAPVRDFNVMSRRARVTHRCGCESLAGDSALQVPHGPWRFVHLVSGRIAVAAEETSIALNAGESLLADGVHELGIRTAAHCEFVWAVFDSR